jgi:hypothetical protein
VNRKEKWAFAIVGALAMTSGGFAFGQSVNNVSSDQVIYACVTGVNGNITKVSNTPKTCPRGTTPISWNMVGPKGEQGLPGSPGIAGPKGDTGIPGLKGENGLSSSSALTTFLVDEQGAKYPIYAGPLGTTVRINGKDYKYSDEPANPITVFNNNWGMFYYTDTNCSVGRSVTATKTGPLPRDNTVYSGGLSDSDGNSINAMTLTLTTSAESQLLKSFRYSAGEDSCISIDLPYYKQSFSKWGGRIKSFMKEILERNPTSGFLTADYDRCWIHGHVSFIDGSDYSLDQRYDECNKLESYSDQKAEQESYWSKAALGMGWTGALTFGFDESTDRGLKGVKYAANYWSKCYSDLNSLVYAVTPDTYYDPYAPKPFQIVVE